MKKLSIIFLFLTLFSCKKENNTPVIAKPAGKYLTEIKLYDRSGSMDTIKYVVFKYDENRFLTQIMEYGLNKQVGETRDYFYNDKGQVEKIEIYDNSNVLKSEELITYRNQKPEYYEMYIKGSTGFKLDDRYRVDTDSVGRITESHISESEAGNFTETGDYIKYFYNSEGNIYKSVIHEGSSIFINEYGYDSMINPFLSLNLPYDDETLQGMLDVNYHSMNNVIYNKATVEYPSKGNDTIKYTFEKHFKYTYLNGYPISKDSTYFYYYKDL